MRIRVRRRRYVPNHHLVMTRRSPFLQQRNDTDSQPASAVTCPNPTAICATNNYYGVHGCCDPAVAKSSSCIVPTACVPYTSSSPSSTSSSDEELTITRCTDSASPSCYEWHFIYDRTTMIQHGCAASAFTSTAFRSLGMSVQTASSQEKDTVTTTVTADPVMSNIPTASSDTSSSAATSAESGAGKPSLGAIVGGTIGACSFVSFIAFVVFLAWRRRKAHSSLPLDCQQQHSHSTVQYDPLGFPSPGFSSPGFPSPGYPSPVGTYIDVDGQKAWQQHGTFQNVHQYPGMGQIEIVEVDGRQRAVEAPTAEKDCRIMAEAPAAEKK
jgi:hypothetical protein